MRALHAAGDSGEALRCYAQTRRHLVEELGTEPGRRLWELHQEILREQPLGHGHGHEHEPMPALPAASATRPPPTAPGNGHRAGREPSAPAGISVPYTAPAQLPMGVPGFTGRTDELARLGALLVDAARRPTAVVRLRRLPETVAPPLRVRLVALGKPAEKSIECDPLEVEAAE